MRNREAEALWKQYTLNINLFKYYLNVVIQVNLFFYAITGGILSFFFSQPQKEVVRYSLVLPMIMSLFLACMTIFGAVQNRNIEDEIKRISGELNLSVYPDVRVLTYVLITCAVFFFIVLLGLLILFIYAQSLFPAPTK